MRLWPFIILLCAASTALGQEEARIVETRSLPVGQGSAGASHTLRLWLHVFRGGRWSPEEVASAVRGAADMLRQCGVALSRAELRVVQAPQRYRWYSTARARELLARLPVPKPAVFFVDDTLNDPAFDAEAIGRANATSSSISCPTVGPTARRRAT